MKILLVSIPVPANLKIQSGKSDLEVVYANFQAQIHLNGILCDAPVEHAVFGVSSERPIHNRPQDDILDDILPHIGIGLVSAWGR